MGATMVISPAVTGTIVIHLVDVMAGGAARRQPPFGDAHFRCIDLDVRFGAEASFFASYSGRDCSRHNTMNTNTANTTMWTMPNRMLVRPVPGEHAQREGEQQDQHVLADRPSSNCCRA